MGRVIQLHPPRRCEACTHFDDVEVAGDVVSYCTNWTETIDDHRVAAECPDYEPR